MTRFRSAHAPAFRHGEQVNELARLLTELPGLAARADQARDTSRTARRAPSIGSRLPQGVQDVLNELDRGREFPTLLARLSRCVREVCLTYDIKTLPDLLPEGLETWQSECGWLAASRRVWDPLYDPDASEQAEEPPEASADLAETSETLWCRTWILLELTAIEHALTRKITTRVPVKTPTTCTACGQPLTPHITATIATVECDHCERVIAMSEAPDLPASLPDISSRIGVPERTLQSWAQAGLLTPASRHRPSPRRPALYRPSAVRRLASMIRSERAT